MKKCAKENFPAVANSIVPICFFLRFLCPTLVQPEEFGVVKRTTRHFSSFTHIALEKPSPHVFKALLVISKLIQNIANGVIKNNITSYTPHDETILNFIKKHVMSVRDVTETLMVPEPSSVGRRD